ncbi:hypothetical protein QR680_017966 [Steinernema hermaphroditum]|uniref:G-protein coupled receptors family 1 profile domain-containing protein n=1 Tax=Steinernema hermaphroditum TaxID=289476 RepID=A0AA39LPZ5_9BILA|nr:hypothetical protein QR680_017966 [Steinernema hermaphroditum]
MVQRVIDGHFLVGSVDYCELGKQMSENIYYRSLLMFRMIVCLVGIFLLSCLLTSKISSVILHVHARILLKYHIIISLVLTLNYFCISLFELIRHSRQVDDPCGYTMPRWLSFVPHFVTGNMIHCQILSCLLIAIERLICTSKIRTYENVNYRKTLIVALFLMTLTVISGSYIVLGTTANWEIRLFYVSFRDVSNHFYASAYVFAQFCGDLVTVILCKIVDLVNRRARRNFVHGSFCGNKAFISTQLSSKLQIRENIAMSGTLLPVVVVHCLITAFSALVISMSMMTLRGNILLSVIISESCSLFPIYSIVMSFLIFRRHPSLFWPVAEKICGRKLTKADAPTRKNEEEFEKHFKWFDEMLDSRKIPTQV